MKKTDTSEHDYLWDGSGEPDPEVVRLETLLGRLRQPGALPALPARPRRVRRTITWTLAGLSAVAAALLIAAAGWYAVGRYNYSLLDKRLVDGLAGVEYNAGCWVFRSVVQRLQAATNVTSTAIIFQIEFNGLGQIGTDQAANFMRRNVPGYSVTNPSDPTLAPPSGRPSLPFEQVF